MGRGGVKCEFEEGGNSENPNAMKEGTRRRGLGERERESEREREVTYIRWVRQLAVS